MKKIYLLCLSIIAISGCSDSNPTELKEVKPENFSDDIDKNIQNLLKSATEV